MHLKLELKKQQHQINIQTNIYSSKPQNVIYAVGVCNPK